MISLRLKHFDQVEISNYDCSKFLVVQFLPISSFHKSFLRFYSLKSPNFFLLFSYFDEEIFLEIFYHRLLSMQSERFSELLKFLHICLIGKYFVVSERNLGSAQATLFLFQVTVSFFLKYFLLLFSSVGWF